MNNYNKSAYIKERQGKPSLYVVIYLQFSFIRKLLIVLSKAPTVFSKAPSVFQKALMVF